MTRKVQDGEVRWGILGVGDVCEVKSAPAMNMVANSRLVAVMRRNAEQAEDYARRHGVPRWYSDAGSLIRDPEVNAIYIATPPNAHRHLTLQAAAAGKPVYVEKPMARTYSECRDMISACEQAGVPLYVAYYRRYLPHFVKAKQLLESGAIGEIRQVRITLNQELVPQATGKHQDNWRVDPEIAGGGYFYDLGSHQLDLLDFLLGPIESARGFADNHADQYAAEDIVSAAMRFESGVLASGSWCFTTGRVSSKDEIMIVGNKGQISFATFGKGEITLETDSGGEQVAAYDLPVHIQQPLIESVVKDLLGAGICASTGESAARTNLILESIIGPVSERR